MKCLVYCIALLVLLFSCRRNSNTNYATVICNCYDEIHSASVQLEDKKSIEEKVNICNTMLSDKLSSLNSETEKTAFLTNFRACREN